MGVQFQGEFWGQFLQTIAQNMGLKDFLFNQKIFEFQIVIICFETYFCVGLGFNGGWTTVCALAILLQTLLIVIMVALSASSVHEEVSLSQ